MPPIDNETKLLLHCNGSGSVFPDSSFFNHPVTAYNGAVVDNANYVFPNGSALFGGIGRYLGVPQSDDWLFGTGDFTIDFRIRFNSYHDARMYGHGYIPVIALDYFPTGGGLGRIDFAVYVGGPSPYICYYSLYDVALSLGIWYHIALVRYGTLLFLFIDGISQPWVANTPIGNKDISVVLDHELGLGCRPEDGYATLDGNLDEYRISKGIARWVDNFTPPTEEYGAETKYSISGMCKDSEGLPLEGVHVVLSGDASDEKVTGPDGLYSFEDLEEDGDFIVTPGAVEGYTVDPDHRDYIDLEENKENQDFTYTLIPTRSISGTCKTSEGAPIEGIHVVLSGDTSDEKITGPDGTYTFDELENGGDFVVTPGTHAGYTVDPTSRTYTNLIEDKVGQDFIYTLIPTYAISGICKDNKSLPMEGIVVSLTGDKTDSKTTGPDGLYEFDKLLEGDYVVTPAPETGYTLDPASRTYDDLTENKTDQDFVYTRILPTLYKVGAGQTYETIQGAIDVLKEDRGTDEFTEAVEVRIYSGTYPEDVKVDALRPTAAHPLTIQAAAGTHPIISGLASRQFWLYDIQYTTLSGIEFDGVQVWLDQSSHLKVCYNYIHGVDSYGVSLFFVVNDSEIYSNRISNCLDGIKITGEGASQNYRNLFYNNLITSVMEHAINFASSGLGGPWNLDSKILNNTIINDTGQACINISGAIPSSITIKNNIFYASAEGAVCLTGAGVGFPDSDFNCFYPTGEVPVAVWSGETYQNLVDWKLASSKDGASIESDPLFVSLTGANYHLYSTSPCVGVGADLSAIFTLDLEKVARAKPYTLGCYETTTVPPPTPRLKTIIELIVENVVSTLESMTLANGYLQEFKKVDRMLQDYDSQGPVEYPSAYVAEANEDIESGTNKQFRSTFVVDIYLYTNTEDIKTDVNQLIGEVKKVLVVDRTRGGYALNSYPGRVNRRGDRIEKEGSVVIELVVIYEYDQDEP